MFESELDISEYFLATTGNWKGKSTLLLAFFLATKLIKHEKSADIKQIKAKMTPKMALSSLSEELTLADFSTIHHF